MEDAAVCDDGTRDVPRLLDILERLVAVELERVPPSERDARAALLVQRNLTPQLIVQSTWAELQAAVQARYAQPLGQPGSDRRLGGHGWSVARIVTHVTSCLRDRLQNMASLLRSGEVALGYVQDWEAMDALSTAWALAQADCGLHQLLSVGGTLRAYQEEQQQLDASATPQAARLDARRVDALLSQGGLALTADDAS